MATRRNALAAAASGITGSVIGGAAAQSQSSASVQPSSGQVVSEFIYFDDPADEFRHQFRMGRDLVEDQGSTLTWYHWMVFIIPGGRRPEPLMRYEGIEYSYFRHLGDNNYRIHAHNVSFARDIKTNKFTDTVTNPITGERVDVPVSLLLHDPGTIGNPTGFRNLSGDGSYQEVYRQFRSEDSLIKIDSVRSAPPDWPATHIENSCAWVDRDLFYDESITSLPVKFCGHYAFEYYSWLKMPEEYKHGHMTGFWDGKKIGGPTELPREMLDRMEREYPELLEPRWDEFDRPAPFEI